MSNMNNMNILHLCRIIMLNDLRQTVSSSVNRGEETIWYPERTHEQFTGVRSTEFSEVTINIGTRFKGSNVFQVRLVSSEPAKRATDGSPRRNEMEPGGFVSKKESSSPVRGDAHAWGKDR